MSIRECRNCGDSYDPKVKRNGGYIYLCDACSEETTEKYLGRPGLTNKDASITILRNDLTFWKAQIKRENTIGYNANIPLNSPKSDND